MLVNTLSPASVVGNMEFKMQNLYKIAPMKFAVYIV